MHRWGTFLQLMAITELHNPLKRTKTDQPKQFTADEAVKFTKEAQKKRLVFFRSIQVSVCMFSLTSSVFLVDFSEPMTQSAARISGPNSTTSRSRSLTTTWTGTRPGRSAANSPSSTRATSSTPSDTRCGTYEAKTGQNAAD